MFVTSPTVQAPENAIENDGFFPDIEMASFRDENRIDATVSTLRLRHCIINHVLAVNRQLAVFKAAQLAAGVNSLEDIDAPEIDGKNTYTHYYMRAVGSLVKAEVIEKYRDFDTTTAGRETADQLAPNIEELRRNAYWAISDILGSPRSNVELI
ncbi:head completion/stabilization protein [Methylophilus sp. 3sh_L]|uniref:head completion/stabilization protein n=1 Tax=Methylophilus sp. 3sh_L TaxID=3377114 RepID=UPI00398F7912